MIIKNKIAYIGCLSLVNGMDEETISLMLLLFGLTGVARKLLTKNIIRTTTIYLLGITAVSIPLSVANLSL